MKKSNDLSRRNFIKSTAGAGLALTVVPPHVLGGKGRVAPSDKLNVALVGCGTVGLSLIGKTWLDWPELQFISVADPNKESYDYPVWGRSQGATCGLPGGREVGKFRINDYYAKKYGVGKYRSCTAHADFREMLEKEKDLDAIFMTTPDHTHGVVAAYAMKKGVGVASHKPIANFFKEVRRTIDVAKKTKVPTHCLGFTDPVSHHQAKAMIDKGWIGKVTELHRWTNRPVWPQGSPYVPETKPIPEGFDWDLWLGPALPRPYSPEYTHTKFRGWYEFGGGCLCDMGYYGFTADWNALNLGMPKNAEGSRSVFCEVKEFRSHPVVNELSWPHAGTLRMDVPVKGSSDIIELFWYEGGIKPPTPKELRKEGRTLFREGVMFVGEKGSILMERDNLEVLGANIPEADLKAVMNAKYNPVDTHSEIITAFKGGKDSAGSYINIENVAEGLALGNLAIRASQRIEWDNEKMEVTNLKEANAWTDRKYREGWAF